MTLRKFLCFFLVIVAAVYLNGCGKKQEASQELQEPLSMEALSNINATTTQGAPESKPAESKVQPAQQGAPATEAKLEPLPPAGPYKPTVKEIQTALKNAGYYAGLIDGKVGPMTKKAIEAFQKANGIKADGKVGPRTWAVLSSHLSTTPSKPTTTATKKR